MDLLIDVQALQSPATRQRGIDRYARNLVAALASARPGWRIELVQSMHWASLDGNLPAKLPLRSFHPPLAFAPEHREPNERYYADWLTAQAPDALLLTSAFDDQVVVPHFTGPRPPLFVILYDLIPLIFHERYLPTAGERADYGDRFRRLLAADGVLAISEATAQDLRTLAGEPLPRLTTLGGAPGPAFEPLAEQELERHRVRLRKQFGLEKEFILYVGGFDFRKNLKGAMKGFAALPDRYRREFDLVIVCHLVPEHRQQVEEWGRELGITDALKVLGYVSDEQLRALYGLCRVFFFPSLYEGLGLPVLEALRCGAPVVASNRSALPEVAEPVCRLVDPDVPAQTAEALRAALEEPYADNRDRRIEHARRFTWKHVAERAGQALEAPRPQLRGPSRPRIAWVSPLPPALTGIADYSAELLGFLVDRYDIELVVDPAEPLVIAELARNHLVLTAAEVPARHEAHPYDLFVYHVGNNPRHAYMIGLMQRFRGLVVLHDFYLGGLVWSAVQLGAWPVTLAHEVELEGEGKLAARYREEQIGLDEVLERVPLNRRVLSLAEGVIVHSAWSWQRVRSLVQVPVVRVPLAAPVPQLLSQPDERRRLGLPEDAFVIATLGFVEHTKRIDSLFQAVAALEPGFRERTRVVVVGRAEPEQEKELLALAGRLGIGPAVRFTGRVPFGDFAAYARAADVCVQLRYPTRGETSASLLRELGAEAACVISDHGSMAEIPDGVALKVRTPEHEVTDLTAALTHLHAHPEVRRQLGEAAAQFVRQNHDVRTIIHRYAAIIELTTGQRQSRDAAWQEWACESLAGVADPRKAAELVESWVALRRQGQEALKERWTSEAAGAKSCSGEKKHHFL